MSLPLAEHPLLHAPQAVKTEYYDLLRTLVAQHAPGDKWAEFAVARYGAKFAVEEVTSLHNYKDLLAAVRRLTANRFRWSKLCFCTFRYCLLGDILFLLAFNNASQVKAVIDYIYPMIRTRHRKGVSRFIEALFNRADMKRDSFKSARYLIDCWRRNADFINLPEKRILVTATVSAGKSTLINAIIGKNLTRTSQEICTGNLCYLHNKPFEDDAVYLRASFNNGNVNDDEIKKIKRGSEVTCIASHVRALVPPQSRVCIIDTPGVNSALNPNHRKITREALADENYDRLIYVLDATKLGTDDEFAHLQYIAQKVPKEKVVFVLNKLDGFKQGEDSIKESIERVRDDLHKMGYENPVICPLSAYVALLIKRKLHNDGLTEDEQDDYDLYVKKFSQPAYDLSRYYAEARRENLPTHNGADQNALGSKCGLYGLENILFGGI
jgi:GTP-binding protein EngB required for normal cell division